jgi:autotransporter-associated beta strand protein
VRNLRRRGSRSFRILWAAVSTAVAASSASATITLSKNSNSSWIIGNGDLNVTFDPSSNNLTSVAIGSSGNLLDPDDSQLYPEFAGTPFGAGTQTYGSQQGSNYLDVWTTTASTGTSTNPLTYSFHYVFYNNDPNISVYEVIGHSATDPSTSVGQGQFLARVNPTQFNNSYQLNVSPNNPGAQTSVVQNPYDFPTAAGTMVQNAANDLTGSGIPGDWSSDFYTKYDYSSYTQFLQANTEFGSTYSVSTIFTGMDTLTGGPTKQNLQYTNNIAMVEFLSDHYATGDANYGYYPQQGVATTKLYGPYDFSFNTVSGQSGATLEQNAINSIPTLEADQNQDSELISNGYVPTTSRGSLNISATSTAGWNSNIDDNTVVFSDPNKMFQESGTGYQYWAQLSTSGTASISDVVPGTYRMTIYQLGQWGETRTDGVQVSAGQTTTPTSPQFIPENFSTTGNSPIWTLGTPDRSAHEFLNGSNDTYTYSNGNATGTPVTTNGVTPGGDLRQYQGNYNYWQEESNLGHNGYVSYYATAVGSTPATNNPLDWIGNQWGEFNPGIYDPDNNTTDGYTNTNGYVPPNSTQPSYVATGGGAASYSGSPWQVNFTASQAQINQGQYVILTVGLAASEASLTVTLNGTSETWHQGGENSDPMVRSGVAGVYQMLVFQFPVADLTVPTESNPTPLDTFTFGVSASEGVMYDAMRMEITNTAATPNTTGWHDYDYVNSNGSANADDADNVLPTDPPTWNLSGGGSWATATNWEGFNGQSGVVPNAAGATAFLASGPGITTSSTITLNANETLATLVFNNTAGGSSNSYTIAQSGGVGSLTFSNGSAQAIIDDEAGNQQIGVPVTLNSDANVMVDTAGTTLTISNVISGTGRMLISGPGTVMLSGNNTYTGDTAVNSGELNLASAGHIVSSNIIVASGATFLDAGIISASTNLVDNGTTNMTAATAMVAALNGSGALNLNPTILTASGGGLFSGVIAGNGGITVSVSGGTMQLSAANTYTGATSVTGGSLELVSPGALTTSSISVSNGATLTLDSGSTIYTTPPLTDNGTATFKNTAVSVTTLNGTGTLNLTPTALTVTSGGTFSGPIASTGSVMLSGGTLVLSNTASSYSGGTKITGGTLQVDASGTPLGSGAVTVAGGTLDGVGTMTNAVTVTTGTILPGDPTSIGTLTFGSLTLNGGTLKFYNSGSNTDRIALTGSGLSVTAASTIDFYSSSTQTGTTSVTTLGTYDFFSVASSSLASSEASTLQSDLSSTTITLGGEVINDNYSFGSSGNFITLTVGTSSTVTNWTNNGNSNWNNSGNWTLGIPHLAGNAAQFGTDGGAITAASINVSLDANETVGTITFNAGTSYSINQGGSNTLTLDDTGGTNVGISVLNGNDSIGVPIRLNGSLGVSVASSDLLSISGSIANGTATAPALSLSGGGTLVLTGANTYSGATSITAGTLQLGSGGALATSSVNVSSGAGLTISSGGTITSTPNLLVNGTATFNNTADNVGSLTGAGTVNLAPTALTITSSGTFSGSITGSGALAISSGTLELASPGSIASASAAVSSGATLTIDSGASLSAAINLSDNGTTNFKNAAQTIGTLNGSGTLNLNPTALTISAGGTFSGPIAGTGAVTVTGGTLNLSGASVYSGTTTVNGGTLNLNMAAGGTLASTTLSLGGGTFAVNAASGGSTQSFTTTTFNPGTDGVAVTSTSANTTLNLGTITRNAGAVAVFTTPSSGSITQSVATAQLLGGNTTPYGVYVSSTGVYDLAGTSATGVLEPGASTVTYTASPGLNGAVPGYGATNTAYVFNNTAGDGIRAGGSFDVGVVIANTPNPNGGIWYINTGLSGRIIELGEVLMTPALGAYNLQLDGGGDLIGYGGDLIFANYDNLAELSNVASNLTSIGSNHGSGNLVVAGTSTVNFTAGTSSTYGFSGTAYLDGGVLEIANDYDIGPAATAAPVDINGGALVSSATIALDNGGSNPRPIALLGSGAVAAVTGTTLTIDGVISGAGPLSIGIGTLPGTGAGTANTTAVIGNGTVSLSGTNTYTGDTAVNSGTLNLASSGQIVSGNIIVASGAAFTDAGTISTSANLTDNGTTTITAPTPTIATLNGSGALNLNSLAVLTISGGGTFTGVAAGNGGITVSGGALKLSAANTYTGATTVTGGSLEIASPGSLVSTNVSISFGATLTVDSGAILATGTDLSDAGTVNLNESSQNIAAIAGAGTLNLNSTALTVTSGGTFSGPITGSGSLAVAGGTTLLSNFETYTGATTVTGGRFELASPGSLASTAVSTTFAGATLTVDSGASLSASTTLSDSGTVTLNNSSQTIATLNGNGNLNLNPTSLTITTGGTFSGPINGPGTLSLTGGTLTLSGSLGALTVTDAPTSTLNINGSVTATPILVSNGATNFAANTGTTGPAPINLALLSIGSAGAITVNSAGLHANRTVVEVNSLMFANTPAAPQGLLNLKDNDLVVHNGNLSNILSEIAAASDEGQWNGTGGITTSAAVAGGITTLAAVLNDDETRTHTPLYTTFDGQPVIDSDVLVKYTFFGDANFDGIVNASDYLAIDNGFDSQTSSDVLTGWQNGDFNADGKINGDDYTLIDNAFNSQGTVSYAATGIPTEMIASDTEQISAVPEPTTLSLFGLAAVMTLLPRKRRRV